MTHPHTKFTVSKSEWYTPTPLLTSKMKLHVKLQMKY